MGALVVLLQGTASAAPVSLSFYLEYSTDQNDPQFNGYVLFPGLISLVPRPTVTTVASPGSPTFSSQLDAGESFSGSSSFVFSDFAAYKAEIDTSPWILTVDANTPIPVDYTFDVNVSALTNWVTSPVVIAPGLQGAVYPLGSSPVFTWTGGTGFTMSRVQLFDAAGTYNVGDSPGPGGNSYITVANLLAGTYTFLVSYENDVLANPPLSVTVPTNGGGDFPDYDGVQLLQTSVTDRITFTVVPEPGSAGLFLTALAGGALIRRRRFVR